jgi:hypothetical protein
MNNELVTICNFGLGAKRGTVDMRISSEAPTISTMSQHWLTGRFKDYIWDSVESVDVVLLDDLVSEYGIPRYCKIDVEGYEREVIGGLSRRCGIVSFEFTAEFIDHAFDVVGRLISLGYSRYNISFGERDSFHFETWKKYHEFIEALNTLGRSPGAWGDIYAN